MIFESKSDLLEELKEALIWCKVASDLQNSCQLVLGVGVHAPVDNNVCFLVFCLYLICLVFLTHAPWLRPSPRRYTSRVRQTGEQSQRGRGWGGKFIKKFQCSVLCFFAEGCHSMQCETWMCLRWTQNSLYLWGGQYGRKQISNADTSALLNLLTKLSILKNRIVKL